VPEHETPKFIPNVKVTVLIAARNEEEKIGECLRAVLQQNYPKSLLEIIVIDDHSEDDTFKVASEFEGVKVIQLNEGTALNSYKNKAIARGIQQSTGELMVTTDADCTMGKHWLQSIVFQYQDLGKKFISSPVCFYKEQNFFQKIQSLEFVFLTAVGASGIFLKRPFSCNGANLAYTKTLFQEVGGFSGIDHLASGDDELLMHKVFALSPDLISFTKNKDAIVYTTAKKTIRSLYNQRRRWASKSIKYQNKYIVVTVVAIWALHVLLAGLLLAGFFNPSLWVIFLQGFVGKILFEGLFLVSPTRFYGKFRYITFLPVLEIIYIYYMSLIGLMGNTGKYYWKGRKVQ
jgi:cellulose synthase/poly-beta-1,6-N-acetylglucosamine synthase-like glycosyltransferase